MSPTSYQAALPRDGVGTVENTSLETGLWLIQGLAQKREARIRMRGVGCFRLRNLTS